MLDAARADFLIVGATGGRRFIVERDADGVSIVPTPTIDGTRKQYAVKLDGVKVGEDAAFGGDGELDLAHARAFTALAAELVGVAQRALEMAVEYAKERKQFGRPIGSYQAVSHKCAQMLLETEGARSAAYYAAWAADNEPETAPIASSMAKAYAPTPASASPAPRSRCTVASASPGSTTCTCGSSAPDATPSFLGDAGWHRERVADLSGL